MPGNDVAARWGLNARARHKAKPRSTLPATVRAMRSQAHTATWKTEGATEGVSPTPRGAKHKASVRAHRTRPT